MNIEKVKAVLVKLEDMIKVSKSKSAEANAVGNYEMSHYWDSEVKLLTADVKRIKEKAGL